MKTTIELAKECNGELTTFDSEPLCYTLSIANLEKFRKAVEYDFVSRCNLKAYISECENFIEYRKEDLKELGFEDSHIIPLYTLPNHKV